MSVRPGIAITTFNRRELLLQQIAAIEKFALCEFDLVICDDGSTDGTVEAIREIGYPVVAGRNKGVACNKNRGIFYLTHYSRADSFILMDDDVVPTIYGWDAEWTNAASALGHVNYTHPDFRPHVLTGSCTSADPGISPLVGGMCMAVSREAVGSVGYMDIRFGRYGHEHTDYSRRYVRAGYGGFDRHWREKRTLFYVIDTGIRLEQTQSTGSPEEADRNSDLLNRLADEPIYRAPWRSDEQRVDFIAELRQAVDAPPIGIAERLGQFDEDLYLAANPDLARGNIDPLRHYLWIGWREKRKLRP
jgi:glycosyltransferase involved in cell wall biosynthesis